MLGKLLSIATVGSTFANVALLRRFLSGVTGVVALVVVSAIMGCVILVAGLAAAYFGLIHYGLDPYAAALTIAVFMLLIMGLLIGLTAVRLRHLRELPYHDMYQELPSLSRVAGITDAFLDGLLNPVSSRRK